MSHWKLLTARWGSGAGETDEIRIDASTNSLQTVDYEHHEIHSGSHYYTGGWIQLEDVGSFYAKIVTPDTDKWGHFVWEIDANGILETNFYECPVGGMAGGARAVIHANNRNKNCWCGFHTPAGSSATVLTDTAQAWDVDALIGMQVFNQTDGSSGFITDNDATTVTVAALLGGTDNDWDQNDVYEINNSQMIVTINPTAPTSVGLNIDSKKVGGEGFKSNIGGASVRTDEAIFRRNSPYIMHLLSGSDANIVTFRATWYEHLDKH